jgi:Cu+-exporting ATPase
MNALAATDTLAASIAACRHCGEPCEGGAIARGADTFCCAGCASVFALIHEHGLDAFYTCAVTPGVPQRRTGLDAGRFAALDDPAVAARFLDTTDGAQAIATFPVPDLHCGACLWLVERLWAIDPAIQRADADLLRRTVTVRFDRDRIPLRAVAERLASIGYEPALDAEPAGGGLTAERRSLYVRLGVAGFAFGNIMLFSIPRYANGAALEPRFQHVFDALNVALATLVLTVSASGYFTSAWRAIQARRMILDVPVALGLAALYGRSLADILMGRGEGFMDSFTGLVFFLLVGRLFQAKTFDRIAFDRTFRSFLPLSVRVERDEGVTLTPIEALRTGDRILLRPQEVVPADAILLDDDGTFDYAFVTGESRPVTVRPGQRVLAGGRAAGASVRLALLQDIAHGHLARVWAKAADARREPWLAGVSARFGTAFTLLAVGLAIAGAAWWWPDGRRSIEVATAVLIIACPCALTLAAPLTCGTAMTELGRRGFYVRNNAAVLDLARVDAIAFDKTGTLTTAAQGMRAEPCGLHDDEWRLVRRLAAESTHPIRRAIASGAPAAGHLRECVEVAGEGLRGIVDGHDVLLGRAAFVAREADAWVPDVIDGPAVAIDGRVAGRIRLSTPMRAGVAAAIAELADRHDLRLLSGDDPREAPEWRAVFGGRVAFKQSPADKLAAIRAWQAGGRRVAMIGDGLNDAGALAAADVGIAVSDQTACIVPACHAVIDGARLAALPGLLRYARRAQQVAIACFVVSVVYNALGLSLALHGSLTPLATAILMPVSSLTIVGLSVGGMRWYARELGA